MRLCTRTSLAASLTALVLSCTAPRIAPPPSSVRRVAVLPPNNRTGDGLLVAGASLLERYALRTERVTVPDLLAAEIRLQLAGHGIDVVAPEEVERATGGRVPGSPDVAAQLARQGRLDAPVLYLEIRRWDPDAGTHPAFVIVALEATLVDPGAGTILWQADMPSRPVATPGAVTLASAYVDATRKVAEELFASWK
jgi:hypothetical protein